MYRIIQKGNSFYVQYTIWGFWIGSINDITGNLAEFKTIQEARKARDKFLAQDSESVVVE